MAHVFYGPWSLRVTTQESFFTERFVITGSNSSDGVYIPPEDGSTFQVSVDGSEWAIQFQAQFSAQEWFDYEPDRTTAVIPPEGLTVTLTIEPLTKPLGGAIVFSHLIVMNLVSTDPEINPPWPVIPVDFSLPD